MKSSFTYAKLIILCAFLFTINASNSAHAQQLSRTELSTSDNSQYLGKNTHIIIGSRDTLSAQDAINQAKSSSLISKHTSDTINLGLKNKPKWIIFSIMNASTNTNWVLDFGALLEGRIGFVKTLALYENNKTLPLFELDKNASTRTTSPVPITLEKNKTKTFALYVEPAGIYTRSLKLKIVPAEKSHPNPIGTNLILILLILSIGGFAGLAMQKNGRKTGLISSAYFALICLFTALLSSTHLIKAHILMIGANALIFIILMTSILIMRFFLRMNSLNRNENTFATMAFLFTCVGLLASTILPSSLMPLHSIIAFVSGIIVYGIVIGISLTYISKNKVANSIFALSFLIVCVGFITSSLATGNLLPINAFTTNAFIYSSIPQAIILVIAFLFRAQHKDDFGIIAKAKQIHDVQTYERLKKAKESVDQTRLMRVIEQERELMTELREREMSRTEEMRQAKQAADQANAAKSSFLAVISHEIRTPMNGVIGTLRLLKQTHLSAEQKDYIDTIYNSTDNMMVMINDILDFEKIEKGKMILDIIPFDIRKIIDDVLALMKGYVENKNIELLVDMSDEVPDMLMGDPLRLRQVLLNLVSNAIKFTEKGHVKIIMQSQKPEKKIIGKPRSEIYFGIEDTGVGISEDAQKNLFDPFQQADESIARKHGGSGLGLAICKNIVEAMNSDLEIDSRLGQGSTFSFSVMFRHAEDDAMDEFEQEITASELDSMRILVVEDNELNRKVLSEFLKKYNHIVVLAESGEEAIDICKREHFDVILTDVWLSGITGIETAAKIKKLNNENKGVPIIAITGDASPDAVEEIRQAGMLAYIEKPIDYDALLMLLKKINYKKELKRTNPDKSSIQGFIDTQKEQEQKQTTKSEQEKKAPNPYNNFENSDLFNMKVLNNFVKTLGKDAIVNLFESYTEKGDEIIQEISKLTSQDEPKDMQARSHDLRGMAANFGLHKVNELSAEIESMAKIKDMRKAVRLAKKLPAIHAESKKEIQMWLNSLK